MAQGTYTWEQVLVESMKMKEGDQRSLILDHDLQSMETVEWILKMAKHRTDHLNIIGLRNGNTVTLDCYDS